MDPSDMKQRQHLVLNTFSNAVLQRMPSGYVAVFRFLSFQFCKNVHLFAATDENRNSITTAATQDMGTPCGDLHSIHRASILPISYTYARLLQKSVDMNDLAEGKLIHAHMIQNGFEPDIFVENSLVNMYAKCGELKDARREFHQMLEPDVVSWNAIIAGYAQHGHGDEVLKLFRQMGRAGMKPNEFTFGSVLVASSNSAALKQGEQVHAHIIKSGFVPHVFVASSLVNMYAKCGRVDYARHVFDKMPERSVVSWTAMISGYSQHGYGYEAFQLFELMQRAEMRLNKFTLTSVLSAFTNPNTLQLGKQVHACTVKTGFESDGSVGNALVTMYADCGSLEHAWQAFENAPRRDLVSWNAIVTGYAHNGNGQEALKLFCQMQRAGLKPNHFTFVSVLKACSIQSTLEQGKQVHDYIIKVGLESQIFVASALVDMYIKCGSIEEARQVFDKMPKQDMVSWTAMIAGYVQNGCGEEALSLFCQMERAKIMPNEYTMACVLRACSNLAALEQGKQVHAHSLKIGFQLDVSVGSALATMYAKCGCIEDAWEAFERMTSRDVVSWNSMIAGYSQHGYGREVLQLFGQMQQAGIKPNEVTFVNVLSACSHVGLVDEAWHYFDSMSQNHGIIPTVEHYACMVDLLGRAGRLHEAENFIKGISLEHGVVLWRILLGACRNHGNMEIGERVAECLLELESHDSATYVLLSNIYAATGRWNSVEKVRKMMKDRGVIKEAGRSWIEVKSRVHVFIVGDRSHPQTEEIYAMLQRLTKLMKGAGYIPDTTCAA